MAKSDYEYRENIKNYRFTILGIAFACTGRKRFMTFTAFKG